MPKGKSRVERGLWPYILVIAGVTLMSAAYQLFLVPNRIAPGGFTGLATIAHYKLGWPIGLTVILMNAPLFVLALKRLNMKFTLMSLAAMLGLSMMIDLLPVYPVTHDLLLASVYGGLILGAGLGMVVLGGATTGGSDLSAKLILTGMPHVSIGRVLLAIDFVVIALSGVAFDLQMALYALVSLFISARIVDVMQEGLTSAKMFFCVTDKPEAIAERVMLEMERGVTFLEARGAYTGQNRTMLFCVVDRTQVRGIKHIVAEVDPRAFLVVTDAREAMGEGFLENRPGRGKPVR